MKNLSDWRSVRLWERAVERDLRQRHWLWLHGWCIGLLVMGLMWAAAHLQLIMGSQSLALRYLLTLGVGYLGYLLVVRWWAGAMVGRESAGLESMGDIPLPRSGGRIDPEHASADIPAFRTGGGGDFGGGGASGDFTLPGDTSARIEGLAGDVTISDQTGWGEAASGALEVAAGADEGAVVAIPVVAIFLIGLAVLFGAGSLLLLYFGGEVLLTVAVELAFSYVSARTVIRVTREGWLSAVVRLTWKPLLGALFCAVLLGGVIDYFIPAAQSLPQAIQLIQASR